MKKKKEFIELLYEYEKKWEPEILDSYNNDYNEYYQSYIRLFKHNPKCIYDYIISIYYKILYTENIKDEIVRKRLNDIMIIYLSLAQIINF